MKSQTSSSYKAVFLQVGPRFVYHVGDIIHSPTKGVTLFDFHW